MRLDFIGAFGVCKSFVSGVLLYPLVEYMQCRDEDSSYWEAVLCFLGLEEWVYKCRNENNIWRSLILVMVIELVWITLILLELRIPLRSVELESTNFNEEEEMLIDALVLDAVKNAQQSLKSS